MGALAGLAGPAVGTAMLFTLPAGSAELPAAFRMILIAFVVLASFGLLCAEMWHRHALARSEVLLLEQP